MKNLLLTIPYYYLYPVIQPVLFPSSQDGAQSDIVLFGSAFLLGILFTLIAYLLYQQFWGDKED
jgi:hypothetical protein